MDSGARLSAMDAAFLYFEKPGQPLVVASLIELDAALAYPKLLETIEARLATIPRLRQRPQRAAHDVEVPIWADDPKFQLARHVRHTAWPEPGDDDDGVSPGARLGRWAERT
ncbi:MAG: wax ester/triacylglycerol synthase domain-containing protein [bacterium]